MSFFGLKILALTEERKKIDILIKEYSDNSFPKSSSEYGKIRNLLNIEIESWIESSNFEHIKKLYSALYTAYSLKRIIFNENILLQILNDKNAPRSVLISGIKYIKICGKYIENKDIKKIFEHENLTIDDLISYFMIGNGSRYSQLAAEVLLEQYDIDTDIESQELRREKIMRLMQEEINRC